MLPAAFVIAFGVGIAIGPAVRLPANGAQASDFAFDGAIIALTIAFGWRSKDQWMNILWNRLSVIETLTYAAGAVALVISAAIIQGHFAIRDAV